MRIALVYKRLADSGGSERQVSLLARRLLERGHAVHLFTASVRSTPPEGLTISCMPRLPLGRTLGLLAFSAWARAAIARSERATGPFDVRHAFGRTVGQDVYRLGGGIHRTYLELAHGLGRPRWVRALLARHPYQLARLSLEEAVFRPGGASRLIVNSELTRRDLAFRFGLPAEEVVVLRNGTDLQRFRPAAPGERAERRAGLGLPAGAEVALFLGTGYVRKGLDRTLRGLARLAPERPHLHLLVAGGDQHPAAWPALARALGVDDRVRFLGPRPDPEALYRAADVFVLPTAYDPAANATVEALASGLPVVTSETNGASEILQPGLTGTILPAPVHPDDVAEALRGWLARIASGEREAVARAARRSAEAFPADDSCERILEIYGEVVRARTAGRSPAA